MSLSFDPVPVRRSRRGPDPAAIVIIAIVAFVLVAVAKPWQAAAPPTSAAASPEPSSEPASSASASAAPLTAVASPPSTPHVAGTPSLGPSGPSQSNATGAPPVAVSAPASLTWQLVAAQLGVHPTYGLLIVTRPGDEGLGLVASGLAGGVAADVPIGAPFRVTWLPLPAAGGPIMVTDPDPGQPLLALGVTTPFDPTPLDLRFWRQLDGDPAERLTTRAIDGDPGVTDRLFLPPLEDDGANGWQPGSYVVEMLEGTHVTSLGFQLWTGQPPRDISHLPALPPNPPSAHPATADAIADSIAAQPVGPFTIDSLGVASTWPARSGSAMTEASEWLVAATPTVDSAVDPTTGGGPEPAVASVPCTDASVIGVSLPAGSRVLSAHLIGLAPFVGATSASPISGPVASAQLAARQRAFVAFVAPEAGTWPAAVYRIDVTYRDAAGGDQRGSWVLDFAAAGANLAAPAPGPLLEAANRWASAGRTWAVLQGSESGSARATPLMLSTAGAAPAAGSGSAAGSAAMGPSSSECAGSFLVDVSDRIVGLTSPEDLNPGVQLIRLFDGGVAVNVPVAAATVRPGLLLLAPPIGTPADSWQPGEYELVVAFGESAKDAGAAILDLCIGAGTSNPARFELPAGSTSATAYEAAITRPGAAPVGAVPFGSGMDMLTP